MVVDNIKNTTDNKNISLDRPVFQEQTDFKAFENLLDTLSNISVEKITRKEFNDKKWDFLIPTDKTKKWYQKYTLYLPDDLKVYELPAIISRINKNTFWEIIPDYTSKQELKIKIIQTVNYLLKLEKKDKSIEKAISKYTRLLSEMFPGEDINKILKEDINKKDNQKYKEYEARLINIKTKENLEELLNNVEEILSDEIKYHLEESIFEEWINALRLWMKTITEAEQKSLNLEERKKKWENINKTTKDKDLDKKERLLREKIWIDKCKNDLKEARQSWDKEKINEIEMKATSNILKILHEYPYQMIEQDYWYQANKILEYKEIYCVWFSLIWHSFLSELWIQHSWLQLPVHFALEVTIWWINYLFDATNYNKLYKTKELPNKAWVYTEIELEWYKNENNLHFYIIKWDPEKTLLSWINGNKWLSLDKIWKKEEAIKMYNKAIELNPNSADIYNNKWSILYDLWKNDEAIQNYNKSIILNPNFVPAYISLGYTLGEKEYYTEALNVLNKWIEIIKNDWYFSFMLKKININKQNINYNLWIDYLDKKEYIEAIKILKENIKTNPNEPNNYYVLWKTYFAIKHYEQAIKMLEKNIKLNTNNDSKTYNTNYNSKAYNAIWFIYYNRKQYNLAIQNYQKALKINPNNINVYANLWLIYEDKKEYNLAIQNYKKVLELNPNEKEAIKKIKQLEQFIK